MGGTACQRRVNSFDERRDSIGLGEHCINTNCGRHGPSDVLAVHREQNDVNLRHQLLEDRCGFRTVHLGHRKVKQNQIRSERYSFFHGLLAIGGLAANFYLCPLFKKHFEDVPDSAAIVGYENTLRHSVEYSAHRISAGYPACTSIVPCSERASLLR